MKELLLITDVFNRDERKKLLELSKPRLQVLDNELRTYPGKQTNNLIKIKEFNFFHQRFEMGINQVQTSGMKLKIVKSWVNWTNGKKKDINWHSHLPADFSGVYYLKTPFYSKGTLFETGHLYAPDNSLAVFPAHIKHTAPISPWPFLRFSRYTLAMDLLVERPSILPNVNIHQAV